MTDPEWADATYLEPLDPETVTEVIERERPDAILPTLGGQTALNLAVELRAGVLAEYGVELIGADLEAIRRAEDRELFRSTVHGVGIPTPRSVVAHSPTVDVPGAGDRAAGVHARRHRRRRRAGRRRSSRARDRRTGSTASPVGQVLVEEYLEGWQEHELEVMCDARGNAVVVCSIENLDPMGVHTGDSWTVAPQQTLPDPIYQQLREAAFATARAVGVATGGANVQFAVEPETRRVPRDRDEPARLALLGARLEGDRVPDREARGAARGRLHARRAAERHHRQDDGGVRAGARLRRGQGAALRLREVPGAPTPARRRDARGRRGARARPHVPRGVPEGDATAARRRRSRSPPTTASSSRARRSRSPERWDLLLEAARRGLELPGHPPVLRRPRSARESLGASTRDGGSGARGRCRPARGRLVRRRVRGADAVLLRHARGRGRGPGAVGPRRDRARRRAEPDRPGDRVRLLLRPRGAGARASSATRRCSSTRTRRRSRPTTTPPTASTSSRSTLRARARRVRARAAARRRRLVRRADAAAARARRSPRPACRCSATRSTRSTPPRTAAASRRLAGDLGAGVGARRERARRRARSPQRIGYPVLVRPAPRDRRPRDARRRTRPSELRRRRARASSTATSRARSSSTSTRSATARAPGSRRCSSTSSRPASTRATRPASFPGPSVSRGARGRDPRGRDARSRAASARAA